MALGFAAFSVILFSFKPDAKLFNNFVNVVALRRME